MLAHHCAEAGVWDKAEQYLLKAGDQASRIAADAEALAHYSKAVEAYSRSQGDRWDRVQHAALERKMGEAFFRRGEHGRAEEYLRRALTLLGGAAPPPSRWGIRAAIAQQVAVQAWHRLRPRWSAPTTPGHMDPAAEERARIYEAMTWIDYFGDQERLLLDGLVWLNLAEQHGLGANIALGFSAIGIMCDAIQCRWLARSYMRRALALSRQLQHPVALGYAYMGMALCEENEPGWIPAALDYLERSAEAFSKAGHVRGWGAATWQRGYQNLSLRLLDESGGGRFPPQAPERVQPGGHADRELHRVQQRRLDHGRRQQCLVPPPHGRHADADLHPG